MSETAQDVVQKGPLTALFLDDDADILDAAELVLTRHGMRLLKAQSPEAAREKLAANAVDVLLLDLNYRRGDTSGDAGLSFLDEQMKRDAGLPVVVVTGHSGMNIAIQAMRMGAQDFVVKPWNNDRFIASIKAAMEAPRILPQAPQDLNLERSEKELVKAALNRHQFNISAAAKDLGVTRAALYRRMEKHGL
ncbi:hypothetical protein AEAC466_07315 [Asticcacaulis sp. AC466]|nr:hypothetical protein AEAC466_07315 [Asticcacaulis sp. AC466]